MTQPIQSRTLRQIRQSIGYNLSDMILSAATSTTDTSSLTDTYALAKGGDDEYNGRQVHIYDATGTIADGEKSFVSDFDAATFDATVAPVFSAAITDGDLYEMWRTFTVEEVNEAINQAIAEVTNDCLQIKQTAETFMERGKYEYDCLSSFVGLSKVEYVSGKGFYHLLSDCEDAWTAGSANVTVTADESFEKEGDACVKAVEDGGSGTNAILAYTAISSVDLDDCDKIEFWMYSSIALTAGQLQIKIDDTAAIASAVESIDIPAMTAATWYRHSLSLANPHSDVDIISIGIFQVSDVGAFTFYVDQVEAVHSASKIYKDLNPEMWSIVKNSTNYLKLTPNALGLVGTSTQLRLTGYAIPALLSADATASEVDPSWLVSRVTGRLLVSHAKSSRLDIKDREGLSKYYLGEAERRLATIRTNISMNTRWV